MAANRKDGLFSLCYLPLQHYHRYVRKDWSFIVVTLLNYEAVQYTTSDWYVLDLVHGHIFRNQACSHPSVEGWGDIHSVGSLRIALLLFNRPHVSLKYCLCEQSIRLCTQDTKESKQLDYTQSSENGAEKQTSESTLQNF